ncbi:MAG: tyrosine-type recombinase/integrase, partial [Spirochaetales bacterium]
SLSSRRGAGKSKKTGVLTPEEMKALFALNWANPKFKLANLVAATTGLRAGEIVGLKTSDIGADSIIVRCSWLEGFGEKLPKSGEVRQVPILPMIRGLLIELASLNPHGNGFVFWGQGKDAPLAPQHFSARLKDMLTEMTLDGKKGAEARNEALDHWKARNIKFHSWRHFFAARMSDTLPDEKVMRATGHTTRAVYLEYADHALDKEMLEIKKVAEATFGKLIGDERSLLSKGSDFASKQALLGTACPVFSPPGTG